MADWYVLDADRNAVPCDSLEEYSRQAGRGVRHVGDDTIGPYRISTVFLGLDHNHYGGEPLLFETMVFGPDGDSVDMDRCSTWAQAEAMHAEFVERYRGRMS